MQFQLEDGYFILDDVSIPNRDFGELQYKGGIWKSVTLNVSIPNRDFGELQLKTFSLFDYVYPVSIPNRDFGELQWQEPETQAIFSFQGAVARF